MTSFEFFRSLFSLWIFDFVRAEKPQTEVCATALFAVVQPPQERTHGSAETDGAQDERPRDGNGKPGKDNKPERHDGADFRSGN